MANFDTNIESMLPGLKIVAGAINSDLPVNFTGTQTITGNIVSSGTNTFSGANTISGTLTITGTRVNNSSLAPITNFTAPSAINSSATATAAQILSGYITSTSAAGTTITMPTGTALGNAITGCTRGTTLEFTVDNTAGASTITMAVNTNAVQSDWDNQVTAATASVTPAAITPLTIASGTSGIATYKIVFASATAYVFSRVN